MRGETITGYVPGGPTGEYDEQGEPILGADVPFTVTGCLLAPATSDETNSEYGAVVISGWTVYAPPGTSIPSDAVMTIRGDSGWQMEGLAGAWERPARRRGVVFAARKAS